MGISAMKKIGTCKVCGSIIIKDEKGAIVSKCSQVVCNNKGRRV